MYFSSQHETINSSQVTVQSSDICTCPEDYTQEADTSGVFKDLHYDIVCTKKETGCPCIYNGREYGVCASSVYPQHVRLCGYFFHP